MSFNSDENDDEVLMKAIQASLEDMKQKKQRERYGNNISQVII